MVARRKSAQGRKRDSTQYLVSLIPGRMKGTGNPRHRHCKRLQLRHTPRDSPETHSHSEDRWLAMTMANGKAISMTGMRRIR